MQMNMGIIFNRKKDNWKRRKLRNDPTKAEMDLWDELKEKKLLGFKFRRQYGIGPFVIDFYCTKLKLAIEVDGDSHYWEGAKERDKKRQSIIEKYDIHFLRFDDEDIFDDIDYVLWQIEKKIHSLK